MTNIMVLFCTILAGFFVGKHFEKCETQKYLFFCDLKKYAALLKTNVNGKRLELATFNCEFAKSSSTMFFAYIMENRLPSCLSKNQKQLVQSFFDSLSAVTSLQLLANLSYYEELISAEFSALSSRVSNRQICVKLGVLVGVMVGILLL